MALNLDPDTGVFDLDPDTGRYPDLPYAIFPAGESTIDRMEDISAEVYPLIIQHDDYIRAGNLDAANQIINDNPDVLKNFFGTDKFNWLRDTVIAMERFYLKQINEAYERTIQNAVGINDKPTTEEAPVVSYSAEKINRLHNKREILLKSSGWSDTFPYTQTVNVDGILATDELKVIGVSIPADVDGATIKQISKNAGFLYTEADNDFVQDGTVTFKAYKKPFLDFTVITEGG